MKIIVWGMGYVGTVTAACLAHRGHTVVGVEPQVAKVETLNAGHAPVREPGLDELVARCVRAGRLSAVTEGSSHVAEAEVSLICVGTPSAADGSQVDEYIRRVAVEIGRGLRGASRYHTVALRSTAFPGTTRKVLAPLLEEHSGRRAGDGFGLANNPEFLREASALADFETPPYTIIGEWDARSGAAIEELYRRVRAPLYKVSLEEAEIVKLVNNAFHALKIGFANEIGRLCEELEIDGHRVMNLVTADTKLNISAAYLRPGFAFGGSCLPKDLRSLAFNARRLGLQLPIVEAVLPSNRLQIEAVRVKVHELGARSVAVLGLSFKPGTDDLRESPVINLIRDLWQDGVDVVVHDPDVFPERMLGSNRAYLERQLPQIGTILRSSLTEALEGCDAVVVTQKRAEFAAALHYFEDQARVIDLVQIGVAAPRAASASPEAACHESARAGSF
jgi:GDP-mannose 6-dehydrogenase